MAKSKTLSASTCCSALQLLFGVGTGTLRVCVCFVRVGVGFVSARTPGIPSAGFPGVPVMSDVASGTSGGVLNRLTTCRCCTACLWWLRKASSDSQIFLEDESLDTAESGRGT